MYEDKWRTLLGHEVATPDQIQNVKFQTPMDFGVRGLVHTKDIGRLDAVKTSRGFISAEFSVPRSVAFGFDEQKLAPEVRLSGMTGVKDGIEHMSASAVKGFTGLVNKMILDPSIKLTEANVGPIAALPGVPTDYKSLGIKKRWLTWGDIVSKKLELNFMRLYAAVIRFKKNTPALLETPIASTTGFLSVAAVYKLLEANARENQANRNRPVPDINLDYITWYLDVDELVFESDATDGTNDSDDERLRVNDMGFDDDSDSPDDGGTSDDGDVHPRTRRQSLNSTFFPNPLSTPANWGNNNTSSSSSSSSSMSLSPGGFSTAVGPSDFSRVDGSPMPMFNPARVQTSFNTPRKARTRSTGGVVQPDGTVGSPMLALDMSENVAGNKRKLGTEAHFVKDIAQAKTKAHL